MFRQRKKKRNEKLENKSMQSEPTHRKTKSKKKTNQK